MYIYYIRASSISHVVAKLEWSLSEYKVPRYVRIVGAEILLPQIGEFLASHFLTLRRSKQFRETRYRVTHRRARNVDLPFSLVSPFYFFFPLDWYSPPPISWTPRVPRPPQCRDSRTPCWIRSRRSIRHLTTQDRSHSRVWDRSHFTYISYL